jgi:hypothetical protein
MSITPSDEQQAIINAIQNGQNVFVNAVPGSGKTTTVTSLAHQTPQKRILQLTYNASLKDEVRIKTKDLPNIEVHSYHSFCVKFYDKTGYQDKAIDRIIKTDQKPLRTIEFDIISTDETQDQTSVYFQFVKKIIRDNTIKQITQLLLGDSRQSIYKFKGADSRFLSHCNHIWDATFIELELRTSYRLTKPIASFINNIMIGTERIHVVKDGPPVTYMIDDVFKPHNIFTMIETFLKEGFTYDDIFILAPSVRSNKASDIKSPIIKLENKLREAGHPCYVPIDDDGKLDDKVLRGKIVFSTFHTSKGRERKIVFVYSFDAIWYNYFSSTYDKEHLDVCPNELYVAVSRASVKLIVIHSHKCKPLPFITMPLSELSQQPYIEFLVKCMPESENHVSEKPRDISNTDLVRFITDDIRPVLQTMIDIIFTTVSPAYTTISIPSTVKMESGLVEFVADLNGDTIPLIYQYKGEYDTEKIISSIHSNLSIHPSIRKELEKLPPKIVIPADYLLLANILAANASKYINRIYQITSYDWLSQDTVDECITVLDKFLDDGPYDFEIDLMHTYTGKSIYAEYYVPGFGKYNIHGHVDAINLTNIWELKCVDSLQIEHLLQLCVYAWIWNQIMAEYYGPRKFYILNMRTGEVLELDNTSYLINDIIDLLFQNKYKNRHALSDDAFIEQCRKPAVISTTSIQKIYTQHTEERWMGISLCNP